MGNMFKVVSGTYNVLLIINGAGVPAQVPSAYKRDANEHYRFLVRDDRLHKFFPYVEELESLVRGFHHCAQQGKCASCEHFRGNDGCGLSLWERYDELFEEGGA